MLSITADAERRARFATTMLLVFTTGLHLLVAGGVSLSVDEAHYALYGLHLDWSYFDHPPMVGWLQALVLPWSQSEFALRLWPALLMALSGGLLYRLARELYPAASPWSAFAAVLMLQSAVIVQVLGIALVPEDPLLLFTLAAAISFWTAVQRQRWRDWLLLGLFLGLAGLSKYTAVTLAFSVVVYLLWQGQWRLFFTPKPWVAALLALLCILPVLYWNAHHDWISFRYQLGHGAPERAWSLARFLRAEAGQLLAYAPGVFVFGIIALLEAWRHRDEARQRLLLSLVLPPLVLFGWTAGYEETLPHWTLLVWAILAVPAAVWVWQRWQRRWVRYLAVGSLGYSLVLTLVIHSQFAMPWIPFEPLKHPLRDLYGWQQAAERGVMLARAADKPLMVGNWSLASRIAWYGRPQPVLVTDHRFDQFDLWFGTPKQGSDGILLVPDYYEGRDKISGKGKFEQCQRMDSLTVLLGDTPVQHFSYYQCMGYRG